MRVLCTIMGRPAGLPHEASVCIIHATAAWFVALCVMSGSRLRDAACVCRLANSTAAHASFSSARWGGGGGWREALSHFLKSM
jgi:hypothetical protein